MTEPDYRAAVAGDGWMSIREAWQTALYGPDGFYRRESPADHFRTSSHGSTAFAAALLELANRHALKAVWDVGAGGGELLNALAGLTADVDLVGVEIRPSPPGLDSSIAWGPDPPTGARALIVANEILDNIPCDVVEFDQDGAAHVVEIEPVTGQQRLGQTPSAEDRAWLADWWPLTQPGDRAEVGRSRDVWWADLVQENPQSLCVAIDYGHLRSGRPLGGSLASYRAGRQRPVAFDSRHDVTAHVAFDSLQAASGGTLGRQKDLLAELGFTADRPALGQATSDPAGYLRAMAAASEQAELSGAGGLGDFWWLVVPPR